MIFKQKFYKKPRRGRQRLFNHGSGHDGRAHGGCAAASPPALSWLSAGGLGKARLAKDGEAPAGTAQRTAPRIKVARKS